MQLRFGTSEAIGAGIGATLGTLGFAFTGPLVLAGLLVGFALGWVIAFAIGRLCAWVGRLDRSRSRPR